MLNLLFWQNRRHSSVGNNTQALKLLKHLSNTQVPESLERWVSTLARSSRICQNMIKYFFGNSQILHLKNLGY